VNRREREIAVATDSAACHGQQSVGEDACCEAPRRRDYLFWVSLLIVALAYPLGALLPQEAFATWFGATFGGLWLTLLATTVIEVCSEGSTPIAADLLTRAAAPGNSFAFLMAGVATDYTEVMSIRDTTRSWRIALCLPLITVPQIILIGAVLNQF